MSDTVRLVKVGLFATLRVRASALCWMFSPLPLTSLRMLLLLALPRSRKPPATVSSPLNVSWSCLALSAAVVA